jgi:hypothetical protein
LHSHLHSQGKALEKLDALGMATNMATDEEEIEVLGHAPLKQFHSFVTSSTRVERGMPAISSGEYGSGGCAVYSLRSLRVLLLVFVVLVVGIVGGCLLCRCTLARYVG